MTLRRRWAVLLAAFTTAVALVPPTPAAAAEIGPLQIINYNSGLCMDIKDRSTSSGATIHQWTCRRQTNQLWWLTHQPQGNGGFWDIRPQSTILRDPSLCVTNPGWSTANGHDYKMRDCTAPPWADSSQGFSYTLGLPYASPLPTPGPQYRYRLINWYSQMCLEVTGGSTSLGAIIQQAYCDGSAKQLWIIAY